jgi:hypothetical protein
VLKTSAECVYLQFILKKTTHHHSWAKEISKQSAVKFAGVQMAKAAQIHVKTGRHTKRQRLNAPKALLVANPAEQGFSFSLPHIGTISPVYE